MSSSKCKNCGGTEIDVDPSRGDAVCTNCGTVLESSAIVSEVQFEDAAHGGSSAIGQFVSSDSRGGARGFGGTFNYGLGKESREITLQNARKAVSNLGQQLHLNQHCIDTAYNFYKMALTRNLTRGRKNAHVVAACVYMTCRTEGTAHLLIDCSDVLQINVYELGRTYLKLSQALNISIPSIDPCLYVLRFANRLEFEDKTHEVSMTALRLVQRMKKDSMHTGRRPSGLCGAALLMAARMHDFSRTVDDVIKIVKVHESTLRKRLLEFGETPSSFLTLDEFMTVDLEEEQDPPSFKAARIKDRERLQKLIDDEVTPKCLTDLQLKIEQVLNDGKPNGRKNGKPIANGGEPETCEANRFTEESVVTVIQDCMGLDKNANKRRAETVGLGPNIDSFNLVETVNGNLEGTETSANKSYFSQEDFIEGIDDEEIDSYIMSAKEVNCKTQLWNKINADYLQAQKEKEEKLEKEKEEGKPEKKRKRTGLKKSKNLSANTVGEAINKMLKEKKISSKINYDVLKDLNVKDFDSSPMYVKITIPSLPDSINLEEMRDYYDSPPSPLPPPPTPPPLKKKKSNRLRPTVKNGAKGAKARRRTSTESAPTSKQAAGKQAAGKQAEPVSTVVEETEDFEDDTEPVDSAISLHQMLRQHNDSPDEYVGYNYYDDGY